MTAGRQLRVRVAVLSVVGGLAVTLVGVDGVLVVGGTALLVSALARRPGAG